MSETARFTPDAKVKTNFWTIGFMMFSVCVGTGMYYDIKSDLKDLKAENSTAVHVDDLERFGTQIELLNPTLHIAVPKPGDYVRRSERAAMKGQ